MVAIGGTNSFLVAAGIGMLVAMPAGFRFFYVLIRISNDDEGGPWYSRMFDREIRRSIWNVFDAKWVRLTIRETSWNPWFVGLSLAALFLADLVIYSR